METLQTEFEQATTWLFSKFPSYQQIGDQAYKPSLENTQLLIAHFGIKTESLRFIHVAGSNGKGTVCSLLASTLKEAGYRTGLFTSPHIFSFSERIRINGIPIPEDTVVRFVRRLQSESLPCSPSFFEMSFVLALYYFQEQNCAICVIETGLGGRLDATNVIKPLISVITTISLEHTKYLGSSLEAIAHEKGGIIKEGIPVVFGQLNPAPLEVLLKLAEDRKSSVYLTDPKLASAYQSPFLPDSYQSENLDTALTCIKVLRTIGISIPDEVIQLGIDNLTINSGYQARMQVLGRDPMCILDVAHNPEGIEALLKSVSKYKYKKLHLIYGASNDKDLASILELFPVDAKWYLTSFPHVRAASTDALRNAIPAGKHSNVLIFNEPSEALASARKHADDEDFILICGSFFLIPFIR